MNVYIDFPRLTWWFWRTFETMWMFFLTLGILGVLGFKWQGLRMKSMKGWQMLGGGSQPVLFLGTWESSSHGESSPLKGSAARFSRCCFCWSIWSNPCQRHIFSHGSLLFRGDISFLCFHFSRFLAWPKGPIGKHGKNTAPAAGPVPVAEACALAFARGTSAGARCGIATAGTGGWLIRPWFQRCKGAVDVELTDRLVDSVDWFVLDFES